jgi:hypothetical protein
VTTRHGTTLVIDKFVEAQEAKRSDRLRALEYRERQKAKTAEEKPGSSHGVTARHDSSLPALPPPALPCPALQTHVEFALDAGGPDGSSEAAPRDQEAPFEPLSGGPEKPKADPLRAKARLVFETWKLDTGHHRAVLDRKREARIIARLRDGFTPEQLLQAIQNRRNDSWLTGERSGRVYDGIETLLRDRAQVERLLDLTAPVAPGPIALRAPPPRQPDSGYRATDFAEEGA